MSDGPAVADPAARRLADALTAAELRSRPPLGRRLRIAWSRITGPRQVTCEIFTGRAMRVVVPEIVGNDLYRTGYIEPAVTRVLLESVRPGMVVFDVGAHYGYHSVVAADLVGSQGRVVAFEPARHAVELLTANVRALPNVTVERVAVGDAVGATELNDFGVRHSAVNTVTASARVPLRERRRLHADTYDVEVTTLDEYVARTGLVPDVVKLDLEGGELAALQGMREVLRNGSPLLSVETGDYAGMDSPPTGVSLDLLEQLGYRAYEWAGGLRPHRRRAAYAYGNLFFRRDR